MFKTKFLVGILVVAAVLFAQVGSVLAAPQAQDATPITGTIDTITTETDANGVTTVLVTLTDDQGTSQTVRLSVETADSLGLVDVDQVTGEVTVVDSQVGQQVVIDPTTVIPDQTAEEPVHPIAALLAAFFGEDPTVINGYHEDGFGFGVIAQALWISRNLTATGDTAGDASLTEEILSLKRGDETYQSFFENHPELNFDGAIPTNWGQFKKALSQKHNNLGNVVSGHADQDTPTTDSLSTQQHGNGKNKDHGKGHGHGNNNHP